MKTLLVATVLLVAGYMLFDGLRALTVGDYVRPSSGTHAGQLGPWATIVRAVGIDPNSTAMKAWFVLYGATWLVLLGFFVAGAPWSRTALLIAAIGSLWYAPAGTVLAIVQIGLLLAMRRN